MVEGSTSESEIPGGQEATSANASGTRSASESKSSSPKHASNGNDTHNSRGANQSGQEKELLNGMTKDRYMSFKPQSPERLKYAAMEVVVDHGVERAIKVLKRKLIKEGLFKELKSRRYYSKPSEEKKRKLKESLKKIRKEEARRQKSQMMF